MNKTFFAFLLLLFTIPLASAQSVSIGDYSTVVDSEVIVPIDISEAESIAGGVVNVSFNPSIVSVEDVVAGDFDTPVPNVNNESGWIKLVAARFDAVNKTEAVLANIVFRGVSAGTTDLIIVYASLNNESGGLITPVVANGSITANQAYTPRTITVNSSGGADYTSVQAAIDAANHGDTVEVYSGIYYENVKINKRIILRGISNDADMPVIDAGGSGNVVEVLNDGVILDGFKIQNGYTGIYIVSKNNRILNNIITAIVGKAGKNEVRGNPGGAGDDAFGIYISDSTNNTLLHNSISDIIGGRGGNGGNGWGWGDRSGSGGAGGISAGIYVANSTNNSVLCNTVSNITGGNGGNGGIGLTGGAGGAGGTGAGVYLLAGSDGNELHDNTVSCIAGGDGGGGGTLGSTGGNGGMAVGDYILNSDNNTATGNSIFNTSGGAGGLIYGNRGAGGVALGAYLSLSGNNSLYCNDISNNTNYDAYDDTINQWDDGSVGNYYSSYTGTDADGDGIGDVPYVMPGGGSVDRYPLMVPCEEPSELPVHNIDTGDDFSTIQAAIDDASSGDEIHVDSGIYYENVVVHKQLTLRGIDTGAALPVVDARGSGSAVNVTADGVTIEGFSVINTSWGSWPIRNAGIKVLSDNNIIQNISASNNRAYGIYLQYSNNTILQDSSATNNGNYGIYVSQSNNTTLTKNTVRFNGYGISLSCSNNSYLQENIVSDNYASAMEGYGITLYNSNDNTLRGNIAANNTGDSGYSSYGIHLSLSNHNILVDDNASNNGDPYYSYSGGTGIYVGWNSNYNILINNIANNNTDMGITLSGSSNGTLQGNLMSDNQYNFKLWAGSDSGFNHNIDTSNLVDGKPIYYLVGASGVVIDSLSDAGTVYCINCDDVTVKDLTLVNNSNGIYFYNTSNSTIQNNHLRNNRYGIYLDSFSNNNTIARNNARNNDQCGIALVGSSNNNAITCNNASDNNFYGIGVQSSKNNTLNSNIASNNYYGIHLSYSSNSTLYHNNLVNNTNHNAYDYTGTNQWDSGTEGNYYGDDYTGTDPDGDGIGNTPYSIPPYGTSIDRFPLMQPWGEDEPIITPIHDLTASVGSTWINWAWKNPDDGVFNHTMVYTDEGFTTNTSGTNYNLTNLLPGTTHTISTRTVSTESILSQTWVNDTATTIVELPGGLFVDVLEPVMYSAYPVGETIKFNATVRDSTGTPITSNISAYTDLSGPDGTSKHLILSNKGHNFVGIYNISNEDARGLWTVNITAYNATSSGQASIKVFFIGAYFIQPYTDSRSYVLGETANFTARVTKSGNIPLTDQNVSLNLCAYPFNNSTLVLEPIEMTFNETSGLFECSVDTSLLGSGIFSVVFSGNDTDGNTETGSLTIGVSEDFNITVGTDKAYYDRNEPVNVCGLVEFTDGTPLSNTNVSLRIYLKGFMRSYTATTNETGGFNFTFQPFAAEAGNYTVMATATNIALRRTAENQFTIHGLYLAPPSGTLDMAESSSREIDFILYNIGETKLTGIAATVDDLNISDNVDAAIVTTVPSELQPSESAYITLNVSAGTPVPAEAAFLINVSTDQMSDETSELNVKLFSHSPVVIIEPDNIAVGMNRNQTAIKTVTISNIGYGVLYNLTLIQPSHDWMRITSNTSVGDLKHGENTSFDIHIHSYNVSLGTHHDTISIKSDNHETMMVDLTASITDLINGSLMFYVEDDLGQNVSGANISLIDEVVYQEYTAITNTTGYALLSDLPSGRYIYEVSSTSTNTLSQLGSVVVEPMAQPKRVDIILTSSFIDFEWDVIPSTIEDWYRIVLNMTFETDVPVPIIVAFPPYLEYDMDPGDVRSGTLTVANLGIVSLFDVSIASNIHNNVQFTPIVSRIEELKPKSSVQVPYTIELADDASSCNGFTGRININGKYIHFINGEGVASYTGTTVPLIINTPPCEQPEVGTGTITGKVTDASNDFPIEGARVVAGRYSTYADGSGNYTLTNVRSGTYRITAYKEGYYPASKPVLVTKDTTTTVNFQLTPITTGNITGIVTNASDGTLIEGTRVVAGGHSDATDNSGSYTLSGVLTGTHTITASKRGYYTSSTTVIVTKDNTAVVNLQLTPIPETPTGSVSGIVTDIDTGDPLFLALVVTNGGFDFTDGSGSYTITGVPVGRNRVRASKIGYHSASKTVQVDEDRTTIVNFQLKKIIIPPIPLLDCECIDGTPPVIWVYKGPDLGWLTPPPTTPSKMFVENCNEEGTIEFSDAWSATISLTSLWLPSLEANLGTIISSVLGIPEGDLWHGEFIPKQIDPNEETMLDVENMGRLFSDMESFGITLPLPDIFGGALGFVYGPYPHDISRNCLKIIPLGGMEIKEAAINIVFPPWPEWPDWIWVGPPYRDDDGGSGPGPTWEPPVFTETIHEIVRLSISQNATMERDAFWAGLGIRNRMPDTNIENVGVSLHISDGNGSANDKFFIQTPRLEGISDIDGSGSISPLQLAKAQWLIIPKPGAGGVSGQTYNISADITYSVDGNNFRVTTEDVEILVKPQPEMVLDYFIPSDVIGNRPFKLAVMATNDGYGTARNFSIETAQPVIYNPSGLMIDFEIIRSALQGEDRSDSLKINFGDLSPGESKLAWWEMVVSMDGTFTGFTGEYTHSSELGGTETSLIKELNTNIIHREIETGAVNYSFLVTPKDDETYYLLLDSDSGGSTPVSIANYTLVSGPTPGNPNMDITIENLTGQWVIVSIEDPYNNTVPILKVIREMDGSEIPFYNYWMRDGRILIVDHYVEGFDGKYTIIFDLPGSSLTRTPVEYTSLDKVDFTLYSFDYNNPPRSDYMIVVSPLLAQAFVAEEMSSQEEINKKADQIEAALRAVLEKHENANPSILFVDNGLGYKSDVKKLRKDVYGLPFVHENGQKSGDIKTYKEITGKSIEPTKEVWKRYSNVVIREIITRNNKPKYVLILGSAQEFPEYKKFRWQHEFPHLPIPIPWDGYDVFSDSYYIQKRSLLQDEYVAPIGRLPLQFTNDYSKSPQSFSKKAWIHNADYISYINYIENFQKPIYESLYKKEYDEVICTDEEEDYKYEMNATLENTSLFVAGWHGSTREVCAHGGKLNISNVHPLVFASTSCLGSNTGDYNLTTGMRLGSPDELFSSELLSNSASYVGNTGYGDGKEAPKIVRDFIENLVSEKVDKTTLGDSWLQTIKEFKGSKYTRDQFRLLGDPALDTSALDDAIENHISTLPPEFSITINASYNETPTDGFSTLNMNISTNSSQNITYSLTEDQFATGTGAPMVPIIYIDIPMPVNQTIDNATVAFGDSYTTSINLAEYVSILLTPDGAEVIPGIEIHGDYPPLNFTYSLVTVPDERLLKIQAIPVEYNIDSQIAELYRSINVTVYTKPFVEENITAQVHIDPSLDYPALHQDENASLIISLYNDYSATENATDVSVTAEIPDNLEIVSANGTINGTIDGHNVTWDVNNLTTSGVNSFKSVELVIQAPASIPDIAIEQINLTATYSNESGGVYEPDRSVPIRVSLIPPDYVDLTVSNMVIHRPLKLGTPTNVTAVISNDGDIGITYVSVRLLIDGNESSGLIINAPAMESQSVNLSIGGLAPGKHQIATIVQPIGIETNITNNIATEDVDIYFSMLPPLSTADPYNLSYGSTLPIRFTVTDNGTSEFISDNTVNVSILNSTNHIITSFNATSGVLIDSDEARYAVDLDTMNYPELILGETYAVSVTFGSDDALLSYATAYFTLEEDLTPPCGITDLHPTPGTTWVNWTWTNPSDPDFNHTEIYLNGAFQTITSAEHFNATYLTPETSYTISTRTVDTAGNINQTWVNDTATTLPASASTPTIEFTYVPPYGSLDDLEGQVWNVVTPADYKVAVYIYVSGWWTKPTFAEPLTTIQDDGSWTCDITTGGTDQYATRIKAYLVPDGYIPPQMEGNQTLPEELDQNSVANVEVIRKPEKRITFSGYNWTVKSSEMLVGPGPNYFSDSDQNVWVDEEGQLHLKILKKDGKWYCAEVYTTESLGYGKYIFYVASRVDQLDKNVVAGLFTWDDDAPEYNYREIDIEFSRWGQAINDNAQYVVQPWDRYGNMHRFNMELNGNYSTHIFDWSTDSIFFQSLHGHYLSPPNDSYIIESWNYTGGDIPPAGKENVRINLWLVYGDPPSDEQEAELIIKRFEHIAPIDTTPPSSITNLQSTAGTTYLNFTWTDPPDPDFSHVMVYMDGILQTNVTKGVQHFNATGLDPDISYEIGTHTVDIAGNINETWINHTAMIVTSVFDTGSGTYPSIYGRHTGTIKTLHDVNVSTMYTYPCAGTGGHSEYVRIYGNGVDAAGTWNGYLCDYHTITFPAQFTLLAGHTYNYTIETGSYPQMHHTRTLTAPDGEVTCAEFVDANGKRYDNRIPAFRLESS